MPRLPTHLNSETIGATGQPVETRAGPRPASSDVGPRSTITITICRRESNIAGLKSDSAATAKASNDLKKDIHVQFDAKEAAMYTHFDQLAKSLQAEIASFGESADGEENISLTGDGGDNVAWMAADIPKVKVRAHLLYNIC